MAVGYVIDVPGGTPEHYAQLFERVAGVPPGTGQLPPGGVLHVAGAVDGGWRIVDVWESREVMERVLREQLLPAAEELGLAAAEPSFFEAHDGAARTAGPGGGPGASTERLALG